MVIKLPKYIVVGIALAAGFFATVPIQAAYAISRTSEVAYAHQFSCNRDTSCRNGAWHDFGSVDCTNFVSQAMDAAGYGQIHTGTSNNQWFFDWGLFGSHSNSPSWSSASQLMLHLIYTGRVTTTFAPAMSAKYSGATQGDLYFYDWGKGEGWSHTAISTGSGNFSSFYDPIDKIYYSAVTGGSGDRIAQHSTDRDNSPWNLGYWLETDLTARGKMKTVVYHLN